MWLVIRRFSGRVRDDRGAVAIVFALLATVFLGLAAIGVDLGNAMNRKKQNQTSADFAALAGAQKLPSTDDGTLQAVADAINKNQPGSDGPDTCNADVYPVTKDDLKDGDNTNGEVTFPAGDTRIRVVAPATRVQFGLANALPGGPSDTCVQSVAEARIASGATGMAPYYATASCSTGPQVLKSDAGGPSIPFTVPVLAHNDDSNGSALTGDLLPNQIAVAPAGDPPNVGITVTGTNLGADRIDYVGFFNSDQTEPVKAVPTTQNASGLTVTVPNEVQSVQDVWWVRVHQKATVPPATALPNADKWSARSQARPLLVGDATLSCDPESSSGNFGSIDVPWGGNDLDDLEKNIRDGLRPPTTLKAWSGTLPADDACNTHPDGIISTEPANGGKENTNCVQTVTGLKAKPAYDGYLQAPGGKLRQDTSDTCQDGPQNRPARVTMSLGQQVNDDRLSCFLKNDTLRLSDTTSYSGNSSLFVPEIWESPRFTLVPILDHDPSGKKWMPIVRFVPGFITDEVTGSRRNAPIDSGQTENGLVLQHPDKLRAIRVFFFDFDTLPNPPDGTALQDYIGVGKKIITLVN